MNGTYTGFNLKNKIKAGIKVGISFVDDLEVFFLLDENYKVVHYFPVPIGFSFGDLIGPVESVPGVNTFEDVFSEVTKILNKTIKTSQRSKTNKMSETVISFFKPIFCIDSGKEKSFKNLLFLPLMVEILSDIEENGKETAFSKSKKMLQDLEKYRTPLRTFSEDIMLYGTHEDPIKAFIEIDKKLIPASSCSGTICLVSFDHNKDNNIHEAFIPNSFDDLISYMAEKYIRNYHFYCCPNCKRYFAFISDTVTKYCRRLMENPSYPNDIGKTCREVGRLRVKSREIYGDQTQLLFQRQYKATFARKSHGKIPEETFRKWSKQARTMRDKCLRGEISYRALERWFKDYDLRE